MPIGIPLALATMTAAATISPSNLSWETMQPNQLVEATTTMAWWILQPTHVNSLTCQTSQTWILSSEQKQAIRSYVDANGYDTLPEVNQVPLIINIQGCNFHIKKWQKEGSIFAWVLGKMWVFI